MSLVLDASMTLAWYFEDEQTPAAHGVLDLVVEQGAVVPALWRLEVANGFQVAIRRGRLDSGFRDRALAKLAPMPITTDGETDTQAWTSTLQLADRFQLTLYDAAYLELAQRMGLPLATLDLALRVAAGVVGVGLIEGGT